MSLSAKESVVLASALADLWMDWPESVANLMADPERHFSAPELVPLAIAVNARKRLGVPEGFGPADFVRQFPQWSQAVRSLDLNAVPLSVAELDAREMIQAAIGRDVASGLRDLLERLERSPEKAHLIAAGAAQELQRMADHAAPTRGLSVRSPDEILSLPDDPGECLLGDRLLTRGGKLVIAGAGGTGKSRLGTQLAACAVTGRKFLSFPTNGHNLCWLILQGENDNIRLKADLAGIKRWLGDGWPAFQSQVVFHTLETELDAWLSIEDEQAVSSIRRLLDKVRPDVVILDALYTFGIGDLNKDADMRATLSKLQRLIHHGNPSRAIVVIHHAQTGKSGLAKMAGHDRASFGRNSKVLHSWTRGQINVGALAPDHNDLLGFTCGKASNGREFQPFAARLTGNMVYEIDPGVDVLGEVANATGEDRKPHPITPDQVADLCLAAGLNRSGLVSAIRERFGTGKTAAYDAIDRAEQAKAVRQNPATKLIRDVRL